MPDIDVAKWYVDRGLPEFDFADHWATTADFVYDHREAVGDVAKAVVTMVLPEEMEGSVHGFVTEVATDED